MAKRKTIEVEFVRETANRYLATQDSNPDIRTGVFILLEAILTATQNYNGFRYATSQLNDKGVLVPNYDNTRRVYY